jgi:hypothetical protein
MRISTDHVRNTTDMLELKCWENKQLRCYIFSTMYSRWNILEPHPVHRVQMSASNRLIYGTASLDVTVHWHLYRVSPYRAVNSLHICYSKESATAV